MPHICPRPDSWNWPFGALTGCMHIPPCFITIVTKGANLCDFHRKKPFYIGVCLLKEKMCSFRSKFFSLRTDPPLKWETKTRQIASPQKVLVTLTWMNKTPWEITKGEVFVFLICSYILGTSQFSWGSKYQVTKVVSLVTSAVFHQTAPCAATVL